MRSSPEIPIRRLAISNYRSILNLVLPLGRLNVITGANGSGKSNLYRALRLLADTAQGTVVNALATEGGLGSAFWAGPERLSRKMKAGIDPVEGGIRKKRKRLRLGFSGNPFGYSISLGLPAMEQPPKSAFFLDPEIKREAIWLGDRYRAALTLIDRDRSEVKARTTDGKLQLHDHVEPYDSMLSQVADPANAPEAMLLRESIRGWRFYDYLRTDPDSPARRPQVGTFTPVLSRDGCDLPAAVQTIFEVGDRVGFDQAIEGAFPGSRVSVTIRDGTLFELAFEQHGLLRPLTGAELSDGTLRFLMLTAALFTPRPPALLVLNEPETSLHLDLLPTLAQQIVRAAEHSQVWVVTHSEPLLNAMNENAECNMIRLRKDCGQTEMVGQDLVDKPTWRWPDNV